MLCKKPPAVLFMIAFYVIVLNRGEVRADFATGTITFEETSYTVYDSDGSVYSGIGATENGSTNPFFQDSGGLTRVESSPGVLSHYTLTMQDGAVVPYDAYFKSGDIYVRFAFDLSSGSSSGSIDSGDLSAVIERTYHSTKSELDGDVSAYTGLNDTHKDYVKSGYETQAGDFFVRAFKNTDPVEAGDGTSTDTNFDHGNKAIVWEAFIIEYSATNGATVDSATGEIWDIDAADKGAERFSVTATTTSTTTPTSTIDSPTGLEYTDSNSLDAKPWQWSFSGLDGSIEKIVFTRFGDAYNNDDTPSTVISDGYKAYFPLAFNNFNPTSAIGYFTPEPSSLLAFGGIFSLAVLRRRRRSATA